MGSFNKELEAHRELMAHRRILLNFLRSVPMDATVAELVSIVENEQIATDALNAWKVWMTREELEKVFPPKEHN